MLVAIATFLFRARAIIAYTMDDSFITFRYAQHVAQGEGVTWNVGENPPTEGCTSFLWLAVMSLAASLHIDMETASKALGIACVMATACLVFVAILRSARFPAACLGISIFFLNAHLAAHAVSGMETAVALMLATALFVVVAEYLKRPGVPAACGAGLLALLLGLARPEMNLAAGLALIITLALTSARARLIAWGLVPYVAGGALYFVWRWSYFALAFPLPFYVKQVGQGLFAGFRPTAAYAIHLWPLSPLLLLFGVRLWKAHREWVPAVAGVIAIAFYFIFPAHIMGSNFRFLYPTLGLAAIGAGLGVEHLLVRLSGRRALMAAGLLAILAVFTVQQQLRFRLVREVARGDARGYDIAFVPLARALASIDPHGRRTLAISDAGAVPFLSGWKTIDTFGLNDRSIAIHLRSGYDPARVISAHPDVLVLISNARDTFDPPLPFEALLYTASQDEGYRRIGSLACADTYHLWLMVRDETMATSLRSRLLGQGAAFSE